MQFLYTVLVFDRTQLSVSLVPHISEHLLLTVRCTSQRESLVIGLETTLASQRVLEANDERVHASRPFTVAAVGGDRFNERFNHMIELELVLGLVEVKLVASDQTGTDLASWHLADRSATTTVIVDVGIIGNRHCDVLVGIVGKLNWDVV